MLIYIGWLNLVFDWYCVFNFEVFDMILLICVFCYCFYVWFVWILLVKSILVEGLEFDEVIYRMGFEYCNFKIN